MLWSVVVFAGNWIPHEGFLVLCGEVIGCVYCYVLIVLLLDFVMEGVRDGEFVEQARAQFICLCTLASPRV